MRRLRLLPFMLFAAGGIIYNTSWPTMGATIIANSTSFLDVSNACNKANPNDTVVIPAGSSVWTNETLVLQKRIHLLGVGTNLTFIDRGTNINQMINIFGLGIGNPANRLDTNYTMEIGYITFVANYNCQQGVISIGNENPGAAFSTNANFRFHHLVIQNDAAKHNHAIGSDRHMIFNGVVEGLVDHVVFWRTNSGDINVNGQSFTIEGRGRVAATLRLGTNEVWPLATNLLSVYCEDSVFAFNTNAFSADAWIDGYFDGHYVIRSCILSNNNIDWHNEPRNWPMDDAHTIRSSGIWEFYNNKIFMDKSRGQVWTQMRAGHGVFFSNTMTITASAPFDPGIRLAEYGGSGTNVFLPVGSKPGGEGIVSPGFGYSVNDILVSSGGTVVGGSNITWKVLSVDGGGGILSVSTVTNGSYESGNASATKLPANPQSPSGGHGSGASISFTSQIFANPFWITGSNVYDGNINTNLVTAGYPSLDTVGWGDPSFQTTSNLMQTRYGCYEWSNTSNGTNMVFEVQNFGSSGTGNPAEIAASGTNLNLNFAWNGLRLPSPSELVLSGREYFDGIPLPGYVPYTYPHPLQALGSTPPSGGGGTNDPFIQVQPQDLSVDIGQSATFNVTAGGTAPFTYQWSQNGVSLGAGATGASFTTNNCQLSQNGFTYSVVVHNGLGNVASRAAVLTVVTGSPPTITLQPQSQIVCKGRNATFTVAAVGDPVLFYQWFDGGISVPDTTTSYTVNNVQTNTTVYCLVHNNIGSVQSQTASLVAQTCMFTNGAVTINGAVSISGKATVKSQ